MPPMASPMLLISRSALTPTVSISKSWSKGKERGEGEERKEDESDVACRAATALASYVRLSIFPRHATNLDGIVSLLPLNGWDRRGCGRGALVSAVLRSHHPSLLNHVQPRMACRRHMQALCALSRRRKARRLYTMPQILLGSLTSQPPLKNKRRESSERQWEARQVVCRPHLQTLRLGIVYLAQIESKQMLRQSATAIGKLRMAWCLG